WLEAEAHYFRGRHGDALGAGRSALEALPEASAPWLAALATTVAASDKGGDAAGAAALVEALCAGQPEPETLPAYVDAAARCATHLITAGKTALADALLERIQDAEGRGAIDAPATLGRIHLARAFRASFAGDPASYLELVTRAAGEFERAGDVRTACAARGNA